MTKNKLVMLLSILLSLVIVVACNISCGAKKPNKGQSTTESKTSETESSTSESKIESEESNEKESTSESENESQEPVYAFDSLVGYTVIYGSPIQIVEKGKINETATEDSTESSWLDVVNMAQYAFKNVEIQRYSSLVFFMRSVNSSSVISLAKADGTKLYENKVDSADVVWHKFEIRREVVEETATYQLYVDETLKANDVASEDLNELVCYLQGEYYLSELFAVANVDYVESAYDIILTNPLDREPDDLITEDYPCPEAIELNVHQIKEWGKVYLKDLKLAPYSKIKFYIKGQSSWISFKKTVDGGEILYMDNKDTDILSNGSWNEILIEKNESGYDFYINNKLVNFAFKYNLNEMTLTLNKDDIIVSELFALRDRNYVEITPSAITIDPIWFKTATRTETEYELAPIDYATMSHVYTVSSWCKSSFAELNLLEYEEVIFYVRSTYSSWVTVEVAGKDVLACQDSRWHEIKLSKSENGLMSIIVDGSLRSGNVSNLAQLSMSLTGGDVVYVSEIYGIKDTLYREVAVTFTSGQGFEYKVDGAYLKEGVATVGKETLITFKIELGGKYNQSKITVKANGNTLTEEGGVYTVTVTEDTVIEVLGVVANPLEEKGYVEVARNPFGLTGEEEFEDLGSGYSSVTTKSSTRWSGKKYRFVEVDVDKYVELCFFVKSTTWFEVYNIGVTSTFWANKAESWMEVKLVKGDGFWTVYINDVERGVIVLTNLKDDFAIELGDATIYLSELLGVPDPNYEQA